MDNTNRILCKSRILLYVRTRSWNFQYRDLNIPVLCQIRHVLISIPFSLLQLGHLFLRCQSHRSGSFFFHRYRSGLIIGHLPVLHIHYCHHHHRMEFEKIYIPFQKQLQYNFWDLLFWSPAPRPFARPSAAVWTTAIFQANGFVVFSRLCHVVLVDL